MSVACPRRIKLNRYWEEYLDYGDGKAYTPDLTPIRHRMGIERAGMARSYILVR
jgi:hypothetical protein